jgi:hypothetical protein
MAYNIKTNSPSPVSNQMQNTLYVPQPEPVQTGWTLNSNNPNQWMQAAYGGIVTPSPVDMETRFQRLEGSQVVNRAGRVVVTVPQFSSQSVISPTTANNPFVANTVSGLSIPAGKVPAHSDLNITNSNIKYPQST